MNSGLDTDSIVKALTQRYQTKVDDLTNAQKKHTWKQDAWKTLNKKVTDLFNGTLSKLRFSDAYASKTTVASNAGAVTVVTGSNAMNTTQTMSVDALAQSAYMTGGKLTKADGGKVSGDTKLTELAGVKAGDKLSIAIGGDESDTIEITVGEKDTLSSLASKLGSTASSKSGTKIAANFDAGQGRFYLASNESGAAASFSIGSGSGSLADALGLGSSAVYQAGSDAEITLNGAKYTSSNNNFSINGLTITANSKTEDAFTLTTKNDTSGVYDTIKGFLKEYNELINEMDKLYSSSAEKYKMLSDDEKEAMQDKEVEEWEDKIKSGLLYRDETLGNLKTAMTQAMQSSFSYKQADGTTKSFSLSSFGINTLGYFKAKDNERNAYHIDGDKDDASTSGNTDVLSKMITEDPENLTKFFTDLTKKLYGDMNNLMAGTKYRSSYTIYEDKLMASQYSEYTTKISDATTMLNNRQDVLYKKYAAMEKMLGTLNNTQNSLSGFFGS